MKMIVFIDTLNRKVGLFASWLIFLLVLVIGVDVGLRYIFNLSYPSVFELEWHLFASIFLLGMAFALQKDKHVRVDVFYSRFSDKVKAWIDVFGTLVFLLPFSFVVIYASIDPTVESYMIRESSPDPGGLPMRYVVKSLVPISFFLLMIQGISVVVKKMITAFK